MKGYRPGVRCMKAFGSILEYLFLINRLYTKLYRNFLFLNSYASKKTAAITFNRTNVNYTVTLPSSLIRVGVSRPCSNPPFFANFEPPLTGPPLTGLVKVRMSQLRIQMPIQTIFPTPILKLKLRLQ